MTRQTQSDPMDFEHFAARKEIVVSTSEIDSTEQIEAEVAALKELISGSQKVRFVRPKVSRIVAIRSAQLGQGQKQPGDIVRSAIVNEVEILRVDRTRCRTAAMPPTTTNRTSWRVRVSISPRNRFSNSLHAFGKLMHLFESLQALERRVPEASAHECPIDAVGVVVFARGYRLVRDSEHAHRIPEYCQVTVLERYPALPHAEAIAKTARLVEEQYGCASWCGAGQAELRCWASERPSPRTPHHLVYIMYLMRTSAGIGRGRVDVCKLVYNI